jgi:hypothetical protein
MELDLKRITGLVATLSLGILCLATSLHAGIGGIGGGRAVGGVMIDATGLVRTATLAEQKELANLVREMTQPAAGEMAEATDMRMISLKGLQQAIVAAKQTGSLPDEVEYLAGLQRIEFVFVDQDKGDIVIAGPAEPWQVKDDGSVVGKVTGGATMRLADLVVAMGGVEAARNGGISCSIEPTAEGRQRLQKLLSNVKIRPGQNPQSLEASMKQAFGPQVIHLNNVPADSHYARTLVASDFEMKRVAMGLTPSPVAGLPSYLEMSKNGRHGAGQNPRWWMACDYESLTKTEDGLAWKLSGQGVKTMTEQDIIAADGSVKGAGRSDKTAQVWAEKMTDSFGELSREMSVFADLQNIMDMTVVATLIVQERLDRKAGLDLSVLAGRDGAIQLTAYDVPKAVAPQCSFIRGRSGWVVTASGGVDINAFEVVENQKTDAAVADSRTTALAAAGNQWWWNK